MSIVTPHRTRPVEVLITEPLTTANRGEIARWLEDQGIAVLVHPVPLPHEPTGIVFEIVRDDARRPVRLGDRVVVAFPEVLVADHAHYTLWYEPVDAPAGRTEP